MVTISPLKLGLYIFVFLVVSTTIFAMCTNPSEDLSVAADIELCGGDFFLTDPTHNGALQIGASDITVLCNATHIIGANDTNSIGILNEGYENVTFINCSISQFGYGMVLRESFNTTLRNVSFSSIKNSSVHQQGLHIVGMNASPFVHDIDTTNTVNNRTILYEDNTFNQCNNATTYQNASDYGYMGL